jgi:hypothetical protein
MAGVNRAQEEALLAVFFHELTFFIQFWDFVKIIFNYYRLHTSADSSLKK